MLFSPWDSFPHRDFEHRQFPEDVLCPRKLLRVFYTVTLNITDLTEESSETRNVTIIMQLNDDLDFEMSFGIE